MQQGRKIKLFLMISLSGLILVISFFIMWPSPLYYVGVLTTPGSYPYYSARALGKNGSIFFIRQGLNSTDRKVRSLMICPAMEAYLDHHGGTDEIWETIVYVLREPAITSDLTYLQTSPLDDYIYGRLIPVEGPEKTMRLLYFSVERIRWANVNLFNRPPDYGVPKASDIFDPNVHKRIM